MWPATTLASAFSALEADVAAQLAPVRGIERSQLRTDWHRYAVSKVNGGGRYPPLVLTLADSSVFTFATSLEIVLCDTLNRRAKSACVATPSAMALTASAFWCAVSIGGRPMWTLAPWRVRGLRRCGRGSARAEETD